MTERQKPDDRAFRFAAEAAVLPVEGSSDPKERRFEGVAYSGELIPNHWAWGDLVFDVQSTKPRAKCAVLLEHERDKRLGAGEIDTSDGRAIKARGKFGRSQFAKQLVDDADDGIPFEMSVHIEPGRIDHYEPGEEVEVNGRTFKARKDSGGMFSAPGLTVFRENAIREVSFVTVGADSATTATVFSHSGGAQPQRADEGDHMKQEDLDKALADERTKFAEREAALKASVDALTAQVNAFAAREQQARDAKRKAEAAELLERAGLEASDETLAPYLRMDEQQFAAAAALVPQRRADPTRDANLFREQAVSGTKDDSAKKLDEARKKFAERVKGGAPGTTSLMLECMREVGAVPTNA